MRRETFVRCVLEIIGRASLVAFVGCCMLAGGSLAGLAWADDATGWVSSTGPTNQYDTEEGHALGQYDTEEGYASGQYDTEQGYAGDPAPGPGGGSLGPADRPEPSGTGSGSPPGSAGGAAAPATASASASATASASAPAGEAKDPAEVYAQEERHQDAPPAYAAGGRAEGNVAVDGATTEGDAPVDPGSEEDGGPLEGYPYEGVPCENRTCGLDIRDQLQPRERCARFETGSGNTTVGCFDPGHYEKQGCAGKIYFHNENGALYRIIDACQDGEPEAPPDPPEPSADDPVPNYPYAGKHCQDRHCGMEDLKQSYRCATLRTARGEKVIGCYTELGGRTYHLEWWHDGEPYDQHILGPPKYGDSILPPPEPPEKCHGTCGAEKVPDGWQCYRDRDVAAIYPIYCKRPGFILHSPGPFEGRSCSGYSRHTCNRALLLVTINA